MAERAVAVNRDSRRKRKVQGAMIARAPFAYRALSCAGHQAVMFVRSFSGSRLQYAARPMQILASAFLLLTWSRESRRRPPARAGHG